MRLVREGLLAVNLMAQAITTLVVVRVEGALLEIWQLRPALR
jgi:hypothetical protein